MFVNLEKDQIKKKKEFISSYIDSENAADGSKFDANANITTKNIATLEHEMFKDFTIQINRSLVKDKISELFSEELGNAYIDDINNHLIYIHDETSLKPYCVSISMYPFLINGLKDLGGTSVATYHLDSFCGSFINLIFTVASQFAGAVATVEFLMYFDHFARKDFEEGYLKNHTKKIENLFQSVCYSINQPSVARGYQSVFWNISIYDEKYFNAMFGNFVFPDGSRPSWASLKALQVFFMKWLNKERERSVMTYPIVTAACLTKDKKLVDKDFENFISEELSEGNSFFIFMNDNAHALSSCCRLKNDISDSINEFSYTLGAGGVSTGSVNVITLNINRIIQQNVNLKSILERVYKYQYAYMKIIESYINSHMLPVYDAGYISLDRQYLTIGINGLLEAAEYLGHKISVNNGYLSFVEETLQTIYHSNKSASKKYNCKFNTEFVPAENLGIKNAKWDKSDGLKTERDCFNSYLYKVEDEELSVLDKFKLHGKRFMKYLDGGSAYHCNLGEYPTKEAFKKLLEVAAKEGCEYFCFNIKNTACNDCDFINKNTEYVCIKCKSKNISHVTRIIGYLKKVDSFSSGRKKEHLKRSYSHFDSIITNEDNAKQCPTNNIALNAKSIIQIENKAA